MSGKTARLLALKDQITIYVKELEWVEYYTLWSRGGVHFSDELLKSHLLTILKDPRLHNSITPKIRLPKRKELSYLGAVTPNVLVKNEENENEVVVFTQGAILKREELVDSGECNEMKLCQPTLAPSLKV